MKIQEVTIRLSISHLRWMSLRKDHQVTWSITKRSLWEREFRVFSNRIGGLSSLIERIYLRMKATQTKLYTINNSQSLSWLVFLKRSSKSYLIMEPKARLIERTIIEISQSDSNSKIKSLLIKMWWAPWVLRTLQAFWTTTEEIVWWLLHRQLSQRTSKTR